ncbi:MAG: hydroxymethylbilane synthase [Planctomycetes bacterium]|nr:hydroxymethylbilane synthase [Planctomycetota bacterium]
MTDRIVLRVGTRGSDLALWQTGWISERLRAAHPSLEIERIIIKTHGDTARDQPFDENWPVGGFVGAIEQALSAERIDLAVHSYKDLQTAVTPGLTIAAIPRREVAHDILVTRDPVDLDALPAGFRIGTSSPRRIAQLERLGNVIIVAIRGNVPTRIAKINQAGLDGVVLAAAGVKRLGLVVPHAIELPPDRFVPAPAQGALAVQTREEGSTAELVRVLDHGPTRRAVEAERSFLRAVGAGCHTPVGALATVDGTAIRLHAQLFSDDRRRCAEGIETGDDCAAVGRRLAERLMRELGERGASDGASAHNGVDEGGDAA